MTQVDPFTIVVAKVMRKLSDLRPADENRPSRDDVLVTENFMPTRQGCARVLVGVH